MHDGSRHFASIPEVFPHERLLECAEELAGAVVTDYLSSGGEMWLDFSFRGHCFTMNIQLGEVWIFVDDPTCPDEVLQFVADYFGETRRSKWF
jgi:hypothetical protein